jgi:5'-nucleotidase
MSQVARFRTLAIALASLSLTSLGLAAPPSPQVLNSHSLESDEHDSREDNMALREQARERVGWRNEKGMRDPTIQVKILGFNDFHGQLESGRRVGVRPVGSAAVLASYLKTAEAAAQDGAIIVHAGDQVGASPPASALLQDEPSIQFLNMLANDSCHNFDPRTPLPWWVVAYLQPRCNLVGTLGNHEFDEGVTELLRLIGGGNSPKGPFLESPYKGARFPYVNANVVRKSDGQPILPPYTVKIVKGEAIAIIGAVLKETPTIVTPTGVAGVDFLDEATSINKYVKLLRQQGIHTIIVTIHQGISQNPSYTGPTNPDITGLTGPIVDIVHKLDSEVDLVVSGHTHGFTNALIPNDAGHPILVVQAFSASTAYDDIDLTISRKSGDVVQKTASIVTTWADEGPGLTPDPEVAALTLQAQQIVAPLVNRVVGTAPVAIPLTENAAGESPMGNLIADAQRVRTSAAFAFMNPGGIRGVTGLDAGTVTWGELFTIQPFSNDLVSMDLTGAQIHTLLDQQWAAPQTFPHILKISGIWYRWLPCAGYNPAGSPICPAGSSVQVQEIRVGGPGGALLDPAATYRVTVNSFMATGGDNFAVLTQGTNRVVGPVDLDALVDYVEQDLAGNVTIDIGDRIERQ